MPSGNKFIDALKEAPVSFLIGGLMVIGFVYVMLFGFGHGKSEIEAMKQLNRDCWSRERARYGFEQREDLPESVGMMIAQQCMSERRGYLGIRD